MQLLCSDEAGGDGLANAGGASRAVSTSKPMGFRLRGSNGSEALLVNVLALMQSSQEGIPEC